MASQPFHQTHMQVPAYKRESSTCLSRGGRTAGAGNFRGWRAGGRPATRGFTLVELLIVISIIGILASLLLPSLSAVRESARRLQCGNNLHQIGLALLQHERARGALPASSVTTPHVHSWTTMVLPWLEQQSLFRNYHQEVDWDDPKNAYVVSMPVAVYACPSAPAVVNRLDSVGKNHHVAAGDYGAVTGVNDKLVTLGYANAARQLRGAMVTDKMTPMALIRDGKSFTILIGEDGGRPQWWTNSGYHETGTDNPTSGNAKVNDGHVAGAGWANPASDLPVHGFSPNGIDSPGPIGVNATNNNEIFSFHRAGVNLLYCDGSVRFLQESVDLRVLAALVTCNGGEIVDPNL